MGSILPSLPFPSPCGLEPHTSIGLRTSWCANISHGDGSLLHWNLRLPKDKAPSRWGLPSARSMSSSDWDASKRRVCLPLQTQATTDRSCLSPWVGAILSEDPWFTVSWELLGAGDVLLLEDSCLGPGTVPSPILSLCPAWPCRLEASSSCGCRRVLS